MGWIIRRFGRYPNHCYLVLWLAVLICVLDQAVDATEIYSRINLTPKTARGCIRRLHKDGYIGCSTPSVHGASGTLRLVTSFQDVQTLQVTYSVSSGSDHLLAPVIPSVSYNATLIRALYTAFPTSIAGIVLLGGSPRPYGSTSSTSTFPQSSFAPYPSSTFQWNPWGSNLASEAFPFGFVSLDADDSRAVLERAQWNEERLKRGQYPGQRMLFKYYMYAESNSRECLKRNTCLPVGGYSAWGTFGAPNATARSTVMLVAGTDATSLFPNRAQGAEAAMSQVVAMLAAIQALSTAPNVTNLTKQIAFALFEGEQWSFVGSRRFLHDIEHFKCIDYGDSYSRSSCWHPHRSSLSFTRLNVSRMDAIVELNQIALSTSKLYAHIDRTHEPSALLSATIKSAALLPTPHVYPLQVADPDASTPGLPPSTGWSFRHSSPSAAVVVLTDHPSTYTNQHFGSLYDSYPENVGNDLGYNQICATATLAARSVYISAGGTEDSAKTVSADCSVVFALMGCLGTSNACPLVRQYVSAAEWNTASPPSRSASVYLPSIDSYIRGAARFYRQWMRSATFNASARALGVDPADTQAASMAGAFTSAHLHDAVDPVIEYNPQSKAFDILVTNNTETASMIWTESNWFSDVGVLVFRAESPAIITATGILAAGVAITTFILLIISRRICIRKFKHL